MAALITQIQRAVQSGALSEPFTTADIKAWALAQQIVKDDGQDYAASSIRSALSNADLKNSKTSNKNAKMLHSELRGGKKHYRF